MLLHEAHDSNLAQLPPNGPATLDVRAKGILLKSWHGLAGRPIQSSQPTYTSSSSLPQFLLTIPLHTSSFLEIITSYQPTTGWAHVRSSSFCGKIRWTSWGMKLSSHINPPCCGCSKNSSLMSELKHTAVCQLIQDGMWHLFRPNTKFTGSGELPT